MSVADNVLRTTAFHALAACFPELHRQLGGHPEHEILLKASEELMLLRAELRRLHVSIGLNADVIAGRPHLTVGELGLHAEMESWLAGVDGPGELPRDATEEETP